MITFNNKNIIITGGTDGMGAAAALELCKLGANVLIIGRDETKAKHVEQRTKSFSGQLSYTISDFSLMKNVEKTAHLVADRLERVDYLIHAVGILITNTRHTSEGIEKDFAVSYLSRFTFNELLFKRNKFTPNTKVLNIAASSPKVPSFAQMEFENIQDVQSRVGMKSHGQAQLANDLYTAFAGNRYNIVSIGYGPGSVDTNIRREVPKFFQLLMKPFFYFSTRKPEEVARQFVEILIENSHQSGNCYFYNKNGKFKIADFIDNKKRQNDLLQTTLSILTPIMGNKWFMFSRP